MTTPANTWILLRGLTRESRHWGEFPRVFADAVPGARILTPDLAGNGRLHGLDSTDSVEAMARDCRERLLAEGERPPFQLLAMSLGAMVAVAWAQRYPDEVARCVLINTSMRPFSPFWQRLRPRNVATLASLMLGLGDARAQEARVLRMTSRLVGEDNPLLDDWTSYRQECPVTGRNALRQLRAAARFQAQRQKPAARLLVLASAQDGLVDPTCSRRIATQWAAAFAEHPRAGHDLPLDDGPWVARQVRDWLQS